MSAVPSEISRFPKIELTVEPWPSERPLFVLNLVAAALLWVVSIVSIVGIVYGAAIGVLLFVLHLGFVAHLRGSGVRVTPEQLPEIHAAVARLSARFGMERVPETYVIHGSGALNALATRFAGRDIVVLFSELLEACEGNDAARDMIIAHELGHLHRRHLRWHFLLAPASLVPFLGSALSRAREYTCDRYGLAGAGDRDAAVFGLTVLAAGGRFARRVDRRAMAAQQADLDTGLMTLGEWFATHPPLAKRMVQIDPSLAPATPSGAGALRAGAIIGAVVLPMLLTGVASVVVMRGSLLRASVNRYHDDATLPREAAERVVRDDFARLATFLEAEVSAGRELPWDEDELYDRWRAAHPGEPEPLDPYDGRWYGYQQKGEHFRIWSSGPRDDARRGSTYDSRTRSTLQR
jgi:Zn-dependent protease with chaperone function